MEAATTHLAGADRIVYPLGSDKRAVLPCAWIAVPESVAAVVLRNRVHVRFRFEVTFPGDPRTPGTTNLGDCVGRGGRAIQPLKTGLFNQLSWPGKRVYRERLVATHGAALEARTSIPCSAGGFGSRGKVTSCSSSSKRSTSPKRLSPDSPAEARNRRPPARSAGPVSHAGSNSGLKHLFLNF